MECIGIIIIIVGIYFLFTMTAKNNEEIAIKNEENAKKSKDLRNSLEGYANRINEIIEGYDYYIVDSIFDRTLPCSKICQTCKEKIEEVIMTTKKMKDTNAEYITFQPSDDWSEVIAYFERQIPALNQVLFRTEQFNNKLKEIPKCLMMNPNAYGQVRLGFWNSIKKMDSKSPRAVIDKWLKAKIAHDINTVLNNDPLEILYAAWFFAIEKPFSASDYHNAERLFDSIYVSKNIDIKLSDLYAKYKMGGEDALNDSIKELTEVMYGKEFLTQICSGLMWMKAYKTEKTILQYMLSKGMEMPAKVQERLHSFSNGGGAAPDSFGVTSSDNTIYFDVTALAWKEEQYIGFYDNLLFQDKVLTYSLAIRDEDKNLFIKQKINLPDIEDVLEKITKVFYEEYGNEVSSRIVEAIALSGSGEEKIDGILSVPEECSQLGILVNIAKIGKKILIKFYTLFIPMGKDVSNQKQQTLSILKKLSPSVSMWESSMKDTILLAIEQLLNTDSGTGNNSINEERNDTDGPAF